MAPPSFKLSEMVNPTSRIPRLTASAIFTLSFIFYLTGHILYYTNGLSHNPPSDDMGGDGNWAEWMPFGFLFLSLFTTLFFLLKAIRPSSKPLHLGWYIGIDLFVCLALLTVCILSASLSRFISVLDSCSHVIPAGFFCTQEWDAVHGVFVTGFAFAVGLACHHGMLFIFAARRLDLINRAKRRERGQPLGSEDGGEAEKVTADV